MKNISLLSFIILLSTFSYSQTFLGTNFIINNNLYKKELKANSGYNRVGVSIFVTKTKNLDKDPTTINVFNKFLPKQYDLNKVEGSERFNLNRNYNLKILKIKRNRKLIQSSLNENNYPNKIISSIMSDWRYNSQNNPEVYPNELGLRIYKNITNLDIENTKYSSDKLDNLIYDFEFAKRVTENNYIVVYDFYKSKSYSKIFAQRRRAANLFFSILTLGIIKFESDLDSDRVDFWGGYKVKGRSYLYKVNYTPLDFNNLRNSFYKKSFSKESVDLNTENINYSVEFIKSKRFKAKSLKFAYDGSERGDNGALNRSWDKTIEKVVHKSFGKFQNTVSDLNVKRVFYSKSNKILLDIGSQEGIRLNQRFIVQQEFKDASGKVYSKPIGAIRVKRTVVNDRVLGDDSSKDYTSCYQYQGKKILEGSIIKQYNELGIEFGPEVSYNLGLNQYFYSAKFSFDLSKTFKIPQLRLYTKHTMTNRLSLKYLLESNFIDELNVKGNNIFLLSDPSLNKTLTFENIELQYNGRTIIPSISDIGLSYELNMFNSFFTRLELGYSGVSIDFDPDKFRTANFVIGNSYKYYTFDALKMQGMNGKLFLGFFVSPSLSLYGGIGQSYMNAKFVGSYSKSLTFSNLINTSFHFGCKVNI
jgi:hypothetical protein